MIEEFDIKTSSRIEAIDITSVIERVVSKSGLEGGICNLFVPHTTAGLIINEHADSNVIEDIMDRLSKLAPSNYSYAHSEGNSDSHIKSSIVGNSLQVFIERKGLKLGTWQGIFFCEFDGPRKRKFWVKVIPD